MRDHYLSERGVWVTVRRHDGPPVSGWLVGEIPQGILLATDEQLWDIRLVERQSSMSYSYDHQKINARLRYQNAQQLQKELLKINDAVAAPVRGAISRINFSRLHQFGHRASELRNEIWRREYGDRQGATSSRGELIGFLSAQTDRSTALHREVYESFQDSGLPEVLQEFGPMVTAIPAELTIPAYDLEFQQRENLTSALEATRERPWTTQAHRTSLQAASDTRAELLLEAETLSTDVAKDESKQDDGSTPFSRWVGPSLRILAGTALATANAAIGVTAGLTATVATIGATGVPTYVGVVTSMYTGLAQVADGLEKVGRRK